MNYRAKLLLLFFGTAIFVTRLNIAIMSKQRWDLLLQQRHSKLKTLVATTAVMLSARQVSHIRVHEDESTAAYLDLVSQLRKIRDANRRPNRLDGADIYAQYLYILRPVANHPGLLEFVADAEDSRANRSSVGDIYKYPGGHNINANEL